MRSRFLLPVLLTVASLRAPLAWTDEEAGHAVADVARAVLAALDAKDEAGLLHLAGEASPDPWLVADALCAQERFEAAIAYAQAAPRPAIAGLPTYVDRQRGHPTPAPWRKALVEAERLLGERKFAQAHARLDGLVDYAAITVGEADDQRTITSARILALRGRALAGQSLTGAGIRFVEAAHVAESIQWRRGALRLTDEATRVVAAQEEEHREGVLWQSAASIVAQMNVYLGEYEAAVPMLRARLKASLDAENWMLAHNAGLGLGQCLSAMGHLAEAEAVLVQAYEAGKALGFDLMLATAIELRSAVVAQRGEIRRAVALRMDAAEIYQRIGARQREQEVRIGAALLWRDLAEYPQAFALFDESLKLATEAGQAQQRANVLSQMGSTYRLLGNARKAREYFEQALVLVGELGQPSLVAGLLLNLADLQIAQGDVDDALRTQERALELYTLDENPAGIATACAHLGLFHASRGASKKAFAWRRRALETVEKNGLPESRAKILLGNGEIFARLGRAAEGLASVVEAVGEAERLGMPELILHGHRSRARLLYAVGRYDDALAAAHVALGWVPRVMGGLAEEESAGVRERSAGLFEVGALAAWKLGHYADVLHFQESGRAGALLESLGGRARLRAVAIPPALAAAEVEARAREARALQRLRDAVRLGLLKPVRKARKDVTAARTRIEQIVERIQRETKAAAELVYPRAASADAIRAALGPREVFVSYSVSPRAALATVVTRAQVRVVDLGSPEPIVAACAALDPGGDGGAFERTLGLLRTHIAAPLALSAEVETVLVSPSGPLSYVPMGTIFPSKNVACVPSGTVHALLVPDADARGKGILALGDPVYDGDALTRLPQTRLEVEALGTTVLVGKQATEARLFEAARSRPRWRAVHLACHGLVDVERPMRSALALTADENDDGYLSVLDVLRRELPTDLAVLSACETGRGRLFRGEGIVGLTRAFMVAGAPRVLCSLWKVDDEATRDLMLRFYRLWNPAKGDGVPASEALREAQAHIRAQEKWSHPQYWAAWVLWGLP